MMNKNGKKGFIPEDWAYRRGDIYMVNLSPYLGSEQGGRRPCIVLQNNKGNLFAPTLIIAPVTSSLAKKGASTHYMLENQRGLQKASVVELEQIRTIDKGRVLSYIGRVSKEDMKNIDDIICYSLGIPLIEEVEAP